jgi:uroporphyrinogen decarboxylase
MSYKRELLQATLLGETTDHLPTSVWRHFYDFERTAERFSEAMLGFQKKFDWDFMKVNPRSQYHVEDWGTRYGYPDGNDQRPTRSLTPIKSVKDWGGIQLLNPLKGVLNEHLTSLNLIRKGLNGEVPFVMTIFTPLSIASRLVDSDETMLKYIRDYPKEIHAALNAITESFRAYIIECLNVGVDGIYLATTSWATYNLMTSPEYLEFGRNYDLRLLDAAKECIFNILHVCKSNNMLTELADYPVNAFSWDTTDPTNPTLEEMRKCTKSTLIGGINDHCLLSGKTNEIKAQVIDVLSQVERKRLMLGPGCSIPIDCPDSNLYTLREYPL